MSNEIKKIISKVNFYLKILDVLQIIMTFYQFLVEHDYSFATILGISSFVLTLIIFSLEKLSEAEDNVHNAFGNVYPTKKIEKFILIFCVCYIIASLVILILLELYYEGDSVVFAFIVIYGFPAIFSGIILFTKSMDDNLDEFYFRMYQIACATPFIEITCIIIFEEGLSFSTFLFVCGAGVMYYPVYKVTNYVVEVCSKIWHND